MMDNPFEILGLPDDADEHQVRARYLKLVKQFPPEQEPDKFRQIRAAFEAARDPLQQSESLLTPPDVDDIPTWQETIDAQAQRPPTMQTAFVLSLGNRIKSASTDPVVRHDNGEVDE